MSMRVCLCVCVCASLCVFVCASRPGGTRESLVVMATGAFTNSLEGRGVWECVCVCGGMCVSQCLCVFVCGVCDCVCVCESVFMCKHKRSFLCVCVQLLLSRRFFV